MAWCAPCFRRRSPDGISANLARPTKWSSASFAPGLTRWSLKDRVAGFGIKSNWPGSRWSRLAPLSCWPGLPSEFETTLLTRLDRVDFETTIADLITGQHSDPLRVVMFNPDTDRAEDVSHAIAQEILRRLDLEGRKVPSELRTSSTATSVETAN